MESMFEENGVLEYVKTDIMKPPQSHAQQLTQWKKDVAKGKKTLLEGVRDHVVSNIHGKKTPFAMWKIVTELFKNRSDHRRLALK